MTADPVDGNAIAGLLSEFLAGEPTTAVTVCNTCGDRAVLAQSIVYRRTPDTEVRCSSCEDVLFTIVTRDHDQTIMFNSLRLLRTARPPAE